MIGLSDFLLARITEDWRTALVEATLRNDDPYWGSGESSKWERRITPERLLDECEAKRRIVELAAAYLVGEAEGGWPDVYSREWHNAEQTLELLALPYAAHPDYREEWKP